MFIYNSSIEKKFLLHIELPARARFVPAVVVEPLPSVDPKAKPALALAASQNGVAALEIRVGAVVVVVQLGHRGPQMAIAHPAPPALFISTIF